MSGHKAERWYEIEGDRAYVYDAPLKATARFVSIISIVQLNWYRSHYTLKRVW